MAKLFSWFRRNKKSDEMADLPQTQPAEPTPVPAEPTKAASATAAPSMSSDAVIRKSTTGNRAEMGTESGAGKPARKTSTKSSTTKSKTTKSAAKKSPAKKK